ncbi:hypothetical protein B7494_g3042 [Chlorociboria aeruginascens]|nr:hypothetical protein B7494_g3042 [Chlorociboria aeruginascens]
MLRLVFLLLLQIHAAAANTEKVIFLGPSTLQVPLEHPTLQDLQLEALSPTHWSLRTHIHAEFPTNTSEYGQSSWVLLHNLQERQRYEVRICWAATQPTSFRLETYDLPTMFESPELITSLAQYSESRQPEIESIEDQEPSISTTFKKSKQTYGDVSSTLFLHIFSAADYYTMNQTLMDHVPPVFVDIILDPYICNVFPRSLIPTAAYIIILAIGSWYLSKYISIRLYNLARGEDEAKKKV